jgi:membrane glycosyltransferase
VPAGVPSTAGAAPAGLAARLGRGAIALAILATSAAGTTILVGRLNAGGLDAVEIALVALYAVLILWIGSAFWFCAAGAVWWLNQRRLTGSAAQYIPEPDAAAIPAAPDGGARTAILMPVYNEPADRVFAAMQAIYESVRQAGGLHLFDFYVLSDSTDPQHWVWEERCWLNVTSQLGADGKLYYRRRRDNAGRKPGNIAEFCQRWGGHYDYMAVLDADSVMDGRTLVEMVRRMDADPGTALLQCWPRPVNGRTLFARLQQFSASLVGRLVVAGLGWVSGQGSTYWGHNAIIRVDAFAQCCGLPKLSGKPPLGGEILSHDFVEAALLVRAGWAVRIAPDLGGSYEEAPPNMLESLSRDRRWCQGNMQHLRVLFARRLHWMSRVNLLVGIMSFVSAPLWAIFVGLTIVEAGRADVWNPVADGGGLTPQAAGPLGVDMLAVVGQETQVVSLLALAAVLLLGPKVMGALLVGFDRTLRRSHAGTGRLVAGLGLEILLSALAAPVMMVMHARFVIEVLAGRAVKWSAQQRDADRVSWAECWRVHGAQTGLGAALALGTAVAAPTLFWWLSPVVLGLLVAVPLSYLLGQADAGAWLQSKRLFATPEEGRAPAVLARCRELADAADGMDRPALAQAIADPRLNAVHVALIPHAERPTPPSPALADAFARACRDGLAALSADDWKLLLADSTATRELHLAGAK